MDILEHSFLPSILGMLEERPSSSQTAISVRGEVTWDNHEAKATWGQPSVDELGSLSIQ